MDDENEYGRHEIDGFDDLNDHETDQVFQDRECFEDSFSEEHFDDVNPNDYQEERDYDE